MPPTDHESALEGIDPRTVARVGSFLERFVHGQGTVERFDRTFKDIAEAMRRSLGAAEVTIWIPNEAAPSIDPDTGEPGPSRAVLNPAYTSLGDDLARDIPIEIPLADFRPTSVLESGRARYDTESDGGPHSPVADLLRDLGLSRMWSVPIRAAPRRVRDPHVTIAVAELAYAGDAPAGELPLELAELFGTLAGRALERALWTEQERVIQKAYEALDFLEENRFAAMDPVAKAIGDALQFEACTIVLADERAGTLSILGSTGIDARIARRRMRHTYGHSLSGLIARHRCVVATEDYESCAGHGGPKFPDAVEDPDVRQYLGAPILSHHDELLGVLRLRNKRAPAGRAWPRCLNALDIVRAERTARVLAPIMSLTVKDRQNVSMLERVRHDMDMPATMIRDSAGYLRRFSDEKLANRLEEVHQKLEDFESLAEILLLNSELLRVHDASDLPFEPEYIMPMGDFVAKLCKMLNSAARRKGLGGVLYVDDTFRTIPQLWLDPRFMQIALYNLLQNAIKYSDDDQLIVVEGGATKIDDETWYQIHVKNTGIGVAESETDRIFERHFRTPKAMRKNSTGLGIGLNIARSMVERHGGRLVLTRPHDPTIFTIMLPGSLAERKPA